MLDTVKATTTFISQITITILCDYFMAYNQQGGITTQLVINENDYISVGKGRKNLVLIIQGWIFAWY